MPGGTQAAALPGNNPERAKLIRDEDGQEIRRHAARAEEIASRTADSFVAEQTRSLALAIRAQADLTKKNKKKNKKK